MSRTRESGGRAAAELPVTGPAAPPRSNGELVFAAPWESRIFGITMALVESGALAWSTFQQELVAAIREWEAAAAPGAEYRYYERWQVALERVLAGREVCAPEELGVRLRALAARPHGHDHGHGHGHGHEHTHEHGHGHHNGGGRDHDDEHDRDPEPERDHGGRRDHGN